MEFQELQQLIQQFDDSSIRVFDLQDQAFHLLLSKDKMETTVPAVTETVKEISASSANELEDKAVETTSEALIEDVPKGKVVTSPLVGVTYLSPSPEMPAFIKVGDVVKKGDVLCIVEAMKVMNEIISDYEGTVTEILIENEEVVEFAQPLFRIL